jgi:hypothetical protein
MKLYLTRNKKNALLLSTRKLVKDPLLGDWTLRSDNKYQSISLPSYWFDDVKWTDPIPKIVDLKLS